MLEGRQRDVSAWGSEARRHVPGAAELARQSKGFFPHFHSGARAILGLSCSNEVTRLPVGTANSHWLFPGAWCRAIHLACHESVPGTSALP